ncbi:MAG TPA: hypothetical protein PKK00_03815 [Bacteroidales bacterium]|nr:hypothetical protein [Bacteroidales bacterium]HNW97524.1 hypothetical protein [Bacteroidales bacterium]HPS16568.1 hypothetical protein [Bacteroidales bacterium]HPS16576.1 hypothetical protein [Bacteroidales bacterium]
MKFKFNITTLQDWYNEGSYLLTETINSMRTEIQNNNVIIIEQQYSNAPDEELLRFNSLESLNEWIDKYFPDLKQD